MTAGQAQFYSKLSIRGQPWRDAAACRGSTQIFFPEQGGNWKDPKELCMSCPVRVECLDFALRSGEKHGIWGGKSERQRREMRQVAHPVTRQRGV